MSTLILPPATVPTRRHRRATPGRVFAWVALIVAVLVSLFPFLWVLRTAFSTSRSLASAPSSLLPVDFTLGAFERVLGLSTHAQAVAQGGSGASMNFWLYLRNSVIYAGAVTIGQVFFCAMAAYAFARLRWPGRNLVFGIFLGALLVPPIFTQLPNFILVKDLGLINTFGGMILPGFFMTPFAVFFLRQFFLGLNHEVEESASLDGAGPWRTFFQIVLPMSTAPVTTLAILTFITTWNDYLWPLLVGNTEDTKVLTVALGIFQSQTPGGSPDWAGLMAAALVAAAPVLVLFFAFARRILDSIGYTGTK